MKSAVNPLQGLLMITCILSACLSSAPAEANELPDYLYSKGGIIYPKTGDSTQAIFHTPPDVQAILQPGMLIGVLPEDCNLFSQGGEDLYRCAYGMVLKAEEKYGETVYRIIKFD